MVHATRLLLKATEVFYEILLAEKCKASEIYRICDVYGSNLVKKKWKGTKQGFTIISKILNKRYSMEWKHTDSPVKKSSEI